MQVQTVRYAIGVAVLAPFLAGVAVLSGQGGATRSVADGVYGAEQAKRGEEVYKQQCAACHGDALEGKVGPPLAGSAFLSAWSAKPVLELVEKIHKTMPLVVGSAAQPTLSRTQAIDLTAFVLQASKYRAGQELTDASAVRVVFPAVRTAAAGAAGVPSLTPMANMAQFMRAISFPNSNIIFNTQVKDPGAQKPKQANSLDYFEWGNTVYPGWQAVDNAALALVESTPLFLLPGRRCENGRPVPVDRADWQKYTHDLVEASKEVYKASQARNFEGMTKVAEALNDACANCHKVYRDVTSEGGGLGTDRCRTN